MSGSLALRLSCRAHWYLVVICFPGLEEPSFERRTEAGWEPTPGESGPSSPPVQEAASGPPESDGPILVEPSSPLTVKAEGPTGMVDYVTGRERGWMTALNAGVGCSYS